MPLNFMIILLLKSPNTHEYYLTNAWQKYVVSSWKKIRIL